ncbi:MAG: hypothetical protein QOI11_2871 [Candidatus Eremiobacteraeota bacterium]|jgi:hypothetical protein|nr:hypothetical protein [Candidatus Eremiobacteraeota bacterium]
MQTERPVRGTRYEDDFAQWAEEQAAALAGGRFADLDLVNLADEIGSLSRSDKRQISSCMAVLLLHLLKHAYQPERATRFWKLTEIEQAAEIEELIRESPSLRSQIEVRLPAAYRRARKLAAIDTGLELDSFPAEPPEAILDGLRSALEKARRDEEGT